MRSVVVNNENTTKTVDLITHLFRVEMMDREALLRLRWFDVSIIDRRRILKELFVACKIRTW